MLLLESVLFYELETFNTCMVCFCSSRGYLQTCFELCTFRFVPQNQIRFLYMTALCVVTCVMLQSKHGSGGGIRTTC